VYCGGVAGFDACELEAMRVALTDARQERNDVGAPPRQARFLSSRVCLGGALDVFGLDC
jgi:hypothetical protein